jgi:hypothetical protein
MVHGNGLQYLNSPKARLGQIGIRCIFSRPAAAYSGPASVYGSSGWPARQPYGGPFGSIFARRDLPGKIAHPAGPQGRIQPGVGGDAGNSLKLGILLGDRRSPWRFLPSFKNIFLAN